MREIKPGPITDEVKRDLAYNNAVRMARQHKETCHVENCGVSVYYLRLLLELAGITIDPDDIGEFF